MTTTIDRPNRRALDDALNIYRDAMRPFVIEGLESISGGGLLEDMVSQSLSKDFRSYLERNGHDIESTLDISDFPKLINRYWKAAFRRPFQNDRYARAKLTLIVEERNYVAHPDTQDIELPRAVTCMTLIADILGLIGRTDERRRVEGIRIRLLNRPNNSQPSGLDQTLAEMIEQLDNGAVGGTSVIPWATPVPSFGDPKSMLATLGLNPSPREFVDGLGDRLTSRRLHILESLNLSSWSRVGETHLGRIWDSCRFYFSQNPYDRWFKPLDNIISAAGFSYYAPSHNACHFDLVPFATENTWDKLTDEQRVRLIDASKDTLAALIRDSSVQILILNGSDVVYEFQRIADSSLEADNLPDSDSCVSVYKGKISTLSGIPLEREIHILGFSDYIQNASERDVTAIKQWITRSIAELNIA